MIELGDRHIFLSAAVPCQTGPKSLVQIENFLPFVLRTFLLWLT